VSCYPANPADINLRAMQTMATAFQVPLGYSDHTLGIEVALAAVALGACIIEKHITLDRASPGPDHRSSLEPDEFVALVRGIRTVEAALGNGCKRPMAAEAHNAVVTRRSLVAVRDVPAGCKLTEEMVAAKRPGSGLSLTMLPYILGRCAKQDIPAGTILTLDMVS
jgi:sialic acid synthase SpsE